MGHSVATRRAAESVTLKQVLVRARVIGRDQFRSEFDEERWASCRRQPSHLANMNLE